jgi:hypothetical protein
MNDELVERLRELELRITAGANEACGQAADRIEALTAQLARARQEGWQSIETAPKDGTVILFATPEPGDWRYHMSRADDRWNGAIWLEKATHWMPLPAPPANPSDGDDGA